MEEHGSKDGGDHSKNVFEALIGLMGEYQIGATFDLQGYIARLQQELEGKW